MNIRKICFATGTRADWGLLTPLARALGDTPGVKVQILATNMHLMERYGMTVDEITGAGFTVDERVAMDVDGDDDLSRVKAMALCLNGTGEALNRLKPDLIVILGDRYEMLAVASAAAMMHVPIVHIAGGEVTRGAIDDNLRHAITKLSALHLTATESYRRRVIAMGEDPRRVINTGAIGVWNILHTPLMSREELSESIGFDLRADRDTLLVTYHAATLDPVAPSVRMMALLDALDRHADMDVVITYPNNDARGARLIDLIEAYAAPRRRRVKVVKSLGMVRYLSMLRCVKAVVGNSSSGIVEVPSTGIPTVDIGIRQDGRDAGPSVIHCGDSADEIDAAITEALSPAMQAVAARCDNPYFRPDTLEVMKQAILDADPAELRMKTYHDNQPTR